MSSLPIVPLGAGLLVLAGGASRRMGRPKAELAVGEKSLLGWQLDRLRAAFAEVLVAGAGPDAALPELPPGVRLVHDLHRGKGPLAGIEAGLAATRQDALFVLAVDMPYVPLELAQDLLRRSQGHDAAVPLLAGRPEPVAAVYRQGAAAEISVALGEGRLQARAALSELDAVYAEGLDPAWFANLNTPEDYRAFLAALRQRT